MKYSVGLKYELFSNCFGSSYIVAGIGSCTDTEIVIPSRYEGKQVAWIGDHAFENCNSLKSIKIPSSVRSIKTCAFKNCTSLTNITIPSGVWGIGLGAFENCISLKSITIPSGVTEIDSCAFEGCTSLTSITIPSSVQSMGNSVFGGCSKLTSIVFEDTSAWYRTMSWKNWWDKIGGTSTSVICAPKNATDFTSIYKPYYWYKAN